MLSRQKNIDVDHNRGAVVICISNNANCNLCNSIRSGNDGCKQDEGIVDWKTTLLTSLKNAKEIHCSELNQKGCHPSNLIWCCTDEEEINFISKLVIKFEYDRHQRNLHKMLLCLKLNFGTNEVMKFFLKSLKEEPPSSCIDFKKYPASQLIKAYIIHNKIFVRAKYFIKSIFQITVYYLDFMKDIFLFISLVQIVTLNHTVASFEWQIVFLTFLSIALPQAIIAFFSLAYLIIFGGGDVLAGYIVYLGSILTPAVCVYIAGTFEARLRLKHSQSAWTYWTLWKQRCCWLKMLEVQFESSIQFFILLIVVLISKSKTKNVNGFESLIAGDDFEILVVSCLWSLLSIVLAETNWHNSLKSFSIDFKGILAIASFCILSVLARTFGLILYFAPSMGLFDLLGHYKMGNIQAKNVETFSQMKNESCIDVSHLWQPIHQSSDMTILTLQTFYIIFIVSLVLHQMIIFVAKCFFTSNFLSEKNFFLKLFNIISQQLCPKVLRDWDDIALNMDDIRKNFANVKKEMKALLIIFAVENMFLCVPIMMLSFKIYERNQYLDEFFPQLDEEIWSTKLAYSLSVVGPLFFLVIPFFQYWLFLMYNKHWHPWAMLLQENLDAPVWLKVENALLDEILNSNLGLPEEEIREIFNLSKVPVLLGAQMMEPKHQEEEGMEMCEMRNLSPVLKTQI